MPSLTSIAIKFFKTLDPGLQADVQGDQPYFISPLLAAMNVVHVSSSTVENPLWPSPKGEHIPEDVTLALQAAVATGASTSASKVDKEEEETLQKTIKKLALDPGARKNYYAKTKNLTRHKFSPDHEYGLGLFNSFLDCSKFSVKLPGFNLELFKYFDGQVRLLVKGSFFGILLVFRCSAEVNSLTRTKTTSLFSVSSLSPTPLGLRTPL